MCTHGRRPDDYTYYKPECLGKRLELEAMNHMVTEEMNWAYSNAFKAAKEYLTEETKKKIEEEEKRAQDEKVDVLDIPIIHI